MTSVPPEMADKAFFDELNRRFRQASELARQRKFPDAKTMFYSCLEHAANEQVVVPVQLVLDVWTNIMFCVIDDGKPEEAAPYVEAIEALIAEWESIPDKNNPPLPSLSYPVYKPLIPDSLVFQIPDNFDAYEWKQRAAYYRSQLVTELRVVDDVLQVLYEFASFHCGETKRNGEDVNWYVIKDTLTQFHQGSHQTYTGGMLYLNRNPTIAIGAALTADGCWAVMLHEFRLPKINRPVLKTALDQTFAPDKRALRAYLENLVTTGILIVSGDRFKVNFPQS
ncbi:MAG: hypothetical protein H7Y09_06570 [Chitinophagaceae bacterium]|nr:hypothetical protein [Anaerolineae bacterium]